MSSYQDLETRVETLERRLDFVMRTMRMKAVIGTGVVGPDGQPTGKVLDASLIDLYHMANQQETKLTSDLVKE